MSTASATAATACPIKPPLALLAALVVCCVVRQSSVNILTPPGQSPAEIRAHARAQVQAQAGAVAPPPAVGPTPLLPQPGAQSNNGADNKATHPPQSMPQDVVYKYPPAPQCMPPAGAYTYPPAPQAQQLSVQMIL